MRHRQAEQRHAQLALLPVLLLGTVGGYSGDDVDRHIAFEDAVDRGQDRQATPL